MKRPNFFILGAPKCGTTSLAAWLGGHPGVYIPPTKEPHFFNTDGYPLTRSQQHYQAMFEAADERHLAVGEASTGYLSSEAAVPAILDYSPDARFLVCLRDPVEMAISLHEQRLFEEKEHIADFREAWRLQDERREGRAVSRWCWEPRSLVYGDLCALGTQMERLYRRVDRKRVLPLLLDDLQREPGRAYRDSLRFLGLPDDGRREFPVLNPAKERRSSGLTKLVRVGAAVKQRLGINRGLGLLNSIDSRNVRYRPRPPVPDDVREELAQFFAPEVEKLSNLLGRDLAAWKPDTRADEEPHDTPYLASGG